MDNLSLLQNALSAVTKGQVVVKTATASTNDDAKRLALDGAPHGSVVLSLTQSKGRGRLGRAFSSSAGGLYLSFLVRGELAANPARLTVSAAVATARAIERLTGLSVGIKWVNDLYVKGKKCCGILVEGVYDGVSPLPVAAVVGIGINLSNPLPNELKHIAISLSEAGQAVSVSDMAVALSGNLSAAFEENAPFPIEDYRSRSVLEGKTVTVHTPVESYEAKVLHITEEGELLVQAGSETKLLSAGEVTLHNAKI